MEEEIVESARNAVDETSLALGIPALEWTPRTDAAKGNQIPREVQSVRAEQVTIRNVLCRGSKAHKRMNTNLQESVGRC